MTDDQRCTATTKRGTPCQSPRLSGFDVCIGHAPKAEKAKRGFGGAENGKAGGHARRHPKLVERLAEKVEAELDEWLAPLIRAREATRVVVVGNGPNAWTEEHPDIPTQLKATAEVFDRLVGKPKQTQEISGPDGGPLQTEDTHLPSDKDWKHEVARLAVQHGVVNIAPATNGANGSHN